MSTPTYDSSRPSTSGSRPAVAGTGDPLLDVVGLAGVAQLAEGVGRALLVLHTGLQKTDLETYLHFASCFIKIGQILTKWQRFKVWPLNY